MTKKLILLVLTVLLTLNTMTVNVFASQKVVAKSVSEEVTEVSDGKEEVGATYTEYELKLLTSIIYCEAGYEEYDGKLAVANAVLNRIDSKMFDHVTSIKEAIYDLKRWGRQFGPAYVKLEDGTYTMKGSLLSKTMEMYSSTDNNKAVQKAMNECKKAAIEALEGKNNIKECVSFSSSVTSMKEKLTKSNDYFVVIGSHIFY